MEECQVEQHNSLSIICRVKHRSEYRFINKMLLLSPLMHFTMQMIGNGRERRNGEV